MVLPESPEFRLGLTMRTIDAQEPRTAGIGASSLARVIAGHGANQALLKYAVRELAGDSAVAIMHGAPYGLAEITREAETRFWLGPYEIHAEELETALMLAVAPDRVRMERAASDYPPIPADYGRTAATMGDLARTGVFGDPRRATREKGRRWLEQIVEGQARLWREFLQGHGIEAGA